MKNVRPLILFFLILFLPVQNTVWAKSKKTPQTPVKTSLPADITFLIADLKYNEQDGVKICEIQNGIFSVFSGWDFLNGGDGLVPTMFQEFISQYHDNFWYALTNISDPKTREKIQLTPWTNVNSFGKLLQNPQFLAAAKKPPRNKYSISDYNGIAWVGPFFVSSVSEYRKNYPGVLLLDAAIIPYSGDKYLMTKLFAADEHLVKLKPKWGLYEKKYTKNLAKKICDDLDSDIVVIKPRKSALGNGVIIASHDELDSILSYILTTSSETLEGDPDTSFSYWGKDRCDSFLVEQFIPSDPVLVPQFEDQPYDGTMRVVFFLYYDNQQMKIEFLEGHWKLPKLPVDSGGTLTEIHKSYGKTPHFTYVDDAVLDEVKRQLSEGLPYLYKQMLGI
jgi:hypothetical protein